MAWTTPKSWAVNELLTAAALNTHLRDNLNALKMPPTAAYVTAQDYTTTALTWADVDAAHLSLMLTTSGGDVLVGFCAPMNISVSTHTYQLGLRTDPDTLIPLGSGNLANIHPVTVVRLIQGLPAGAHWFRLQWYVSGGTATLYGAGGKAQFWVREVS